MPTQSQQIFTSDTPVSRDHQESPRPHSRNLKTFESKKRVTLPTGTIPPTSSSHSSKDTSTDRVLPETPRHVVHL